MLQLYRLFLGTNNGYQTMWIKDTTLKQLIELRFDMPTIRMRHFLSTVHLVMKELEKRYIDL